MLPTSMTAGISGWQIKPLGDPRLERKIESLEPGDPFRYDNLSGQWVYGHLIFANASRARVMIYDRPHEVHIPDKKDKKTGWIITPDRTFITSGDEEQNLPLGIMVESLADRHQSPRPQTNGAKPEAKGGPIMTDEVKAAGLIAKYNHQHKQLNRALEAGDAAKAEQARARIDALEAEAAAADIKLPIWDYPEPAATPEPTPTPNIEAAGKKGEQTAKEAAKAKAAKAKEKGALDKKSATAAKAKEPKVKKLKKTHDCLCGCGTETLNIYAPGHDARVKGILLKVERGDMERSAVPETVAPFVKWFGKWKTEGFKLVAAPVKVPGRDDVENTSLKALEALDV